MKQLHRICSIFALSAVAACAHVPSDPAARAEYERTNDPAEPTNRAIFGANQFIDRNALKPVATAYRNNIPGGVRHSVHNFSSNLDEPEVLINDVLQGNVGRAWNTTQRFVVNTTAGGAGLFDVASRIGLPHHSADFGQTFGVWGIGTGPSVTLPLLGPTDVRDAVGTGLGFAADPLNYVTVGAATAVSTVGGVGGALDTRSELLSTTNNLEKNSLDYYATLRSIAAQRRAALVQQGKNGYVHSQQATGAMTSPLAPPVSVAMTTK